MKRSRRGFTLLEMIVAISLFSFVGYSVAVAMSAGNHSNVIVKRVADEDEALREASNRLVDELSATSDSRITVTTLGDGNHRLDFTQPITAAGAMDWGVHERLLGSTDAEQNRVGWNVRYTVRTVTVDGAQQKQLVRQIVDGGGAVQREKVLVEGLENGTSNPPGFHVEHVGSVWVVTLTTVGKTEGRSGIKAVFHVKTRN